MCIKTHINRKLSLIKLQLTVRSFRVSHLSAIVSNRISPLTGLRQKTIKKQTQTQSWQEIYTKRLKIAETQVYPGNCPIEVKQLLCIGLRLFLPHDCLSPDRT